MASLCGDQQHCHTVCQSNSGFQKRTLSQIYFASYRSHAIPLFVASCSPPKTLPHFKSISLLMQDVFPNSVPHNISKLFRYSTALMHSYDTRFASSGNFYVNYSRSSHYNSNLSVEPVPNYEIAFLLICRNYPSLVLRKG